jgi:hypothetical protein
MQSQPSPDITAKNNVLPFNLSCNFRLRGCFLCNLGNKNFEKELQKFKTKYDAIIIDA